MLYKLWRRTQRVWENIVFIWLVNANDLYLKQHPSAGGLFPFHSVKFLSVMQCYWGGRPLEKKNKPRICKHSSSFLSSRKSAHRPQNTRRLVGLWIGDWNLIIFYYNPNNCPLNRGGKKMLSRSLLVSSFWNINGSCPASGWRDFFMLCKTKEHTIYTTVYAALQKG